MALGTLIKTKFKSIYQYKTPSGEIQYYTTFRLEGKKYERKNLSKMFPTINSPKQASDKLEYIKSEIRQGRNPFVKSLVTIDDIVKDDISKRDIVEKYRQDLLSFYTIYVKDTIGHLKLEKVTREHISKILTKLKDVSTTRRKMLRALLHDIFSYAHNTGAIRINPMYKLDYGKEKPIVEIDNVLDDKPLDVARKLYQAALTYNLCREKSIQEYRLLFTLSVMTARRVGELHKLQYGDIKFSGDEVFVIPRISTTKTNMQDKYILPREAVLLLPDDIQDEEQKDKQLFSMSTPAIFDNYNKLIEHIKIKTYNDFKITSHLNRKLMVTILVEQGVDSTIADRLLSHKESSVKNIYLTISYEKRKEAFENYWSLLRS